MERQDPTRPPDGSQKCFLRVAIGKSLIFELDLRYTNHGNQQSNYGTEQLGSMSQFSNFNNQVGTITYRQIARNHIGNPATNPTSYGRTRNFQVGKEVAVSCLTDRLSNTVVVALPGMRNCHHMIIGRRHAMARGASAASIISSEINALLMQREDSRMLLDAARVSDLLRTGCLGAGRLDFPCFGFGSVVGDQVKLWQKRAMLEAVSPLMSGQVMAKISVP